MLSGGNKHLAAKMPALLLRGELIFPVHAGGTGDDHLLHQLERIQRTSEAGLGVRHDRDDQLARPVAILSVRPGDLVSPDHRVVDPAHYGRHRIGRVQALVGIGMTGQVRVRGHLPSGQIDRLQSGLDLLYGLVSGQRPKRTDVGLVLQQPPQARRPVLGQGLFLHYGPSQVDHVGRGVTALNTGPARVGGPVALQHLFRGEGGRLRGGQHGGHSELLSVAVVLATTLVFVSSPVRSLVWSRSEVLDDLRTCRILRHWLRWTYDNEVALPLVKFCAF